MVASTKGKKLSLLKGKKPRETDHQIVIDHEAVVAYATAVRAVEVAVDDLRTARQRRPHEDTIAELQAVVDAAKAEAASLEPAADEGAGFIPVRLRAMAPLAFRALRAEFPPTDEDHAEIQAIYANDQLKATYNNSEFAPRLVAHSLIDPEIDVDTAREWASTWQSGEWSLLVTACMRVNQESIDTSSLVFSSGRTRS